MSVYEKLTVANFALTVVIFVILSLGSLPQLKQGMVVVRDAVLWAALVVVVFLAAVAGLWRWQQGGRASQPSAAADRVAEDSPASGFYWSSSQ